MKKVIISADDLGYSDSVNRAIVMAHRDGILTNASLMVTGEARESAVQLAKENPRLGVGLHVVLICGKSVLSHSEIPDLVNEDKNFSTSPTYAGIQYYVEKRCQRQLEKEIRAQFQRFTETGLTCSHVDSHLHTHINPAVFDIILKVAKEFGVSKIRIPDDDLALSLDVDKSHYLRKVTHNAIFSRLAKRAKEKARARGYQFADKVYGLFQTGAMSKVYTEHLMAHLAEGISEIYFHPDFDLWYDASEKTHEKPNQELGTLLNPMMKELFMKNGIELIHYGDL